MEKVVTMEETTEKKQNFIVRGFKAVKTKYDECNEKHPILTKVVTIGGSVITVGLVFYGACKIADHFSSTEDNVDLLESGLSGVEPMIYTNLPSTFGFDTMKVVNTTGDVLGTVADMGGDYIVMNDLDLGNLVRSCDSEALQLALDELVKDALSI